LWATPDAPIRVLEDVPQPLAQPVGPHVAAWPAVQRWLARTDDGALFDSVLSVRGDVQHVVERTLTDDGWVDAGRRLRQLDGLRWEVATDEAITALLAGCTGAAPLRFATGLLADALGVPVGDLVTAAAPVVRDLVARGFLLPATVQA
jgi:hypothetical protein